MNGQKEFLHMLQDIACCPRSVAHLITPPPSPSPWEIELVVHHNIVYATPRPKPKAWAISFLLSLRWLFFYLSHPCLIFQNSELGISDFLFFRSSALVTCHRICSLVFAFAYSLSVDPSRTRFFQWADYERKWSEMTKKTVLHLPQCSKLVKKSSELSQNVP